MRLKGRIRAYGLSNDTREDDSRYLWEADKNGLIAPLTVQNNIASSTVSMKSARWQRLPSWLKTSTPRTWVWRTIG